MEKHTFGRRLQKYKLLNNFLCQVTGKPRKNGGMNSVQNLGNMKDEERWIFCIGRCHS